MCVRVTIADAWCMIVACSCSSSDVVSSAVLSVAAVVVVLYVPVDVLFVAVVVAEA